MVARLACEVQMLLECDIGNSACKWRLVDASKEFARGKIDCRAVSHSWCLPTERVFEIKVCSVAGESLNHQFAQELKRRFSGSSIKWAKSTSCCGGVKNAYQQAEKLGVDRWSAIVAAFNLYGASVVVDAGSALTVDLVNGQGRHLGGYIAPGAGLMAQSLLRDTAKVRFEHSSVYLQQGLGEDTSACVNAAIRAAQLGVVNEALSQANSHIDGPYSIVVTGGGAEALAPALNKKIIRHPDLVLDGLQWLVP